MLKNLTVRNFLTVIFFAKKNITKKSAKIRLLFIFLSILYLTTKTGGFLTVRKTGMQYAFLFFRLLSYSDNSSIFLSMFSRSFFRFSTAICFSFSLNTALPFTRSSKSFKHFVMIFEPSRRFAIFFGCFGSS